ncbi:cyclophane-forming radical SAM/SPASM peptide maturase GrrM/OscB [Roseibium sp.]|uniref:cyclophane-forming radical SAM/SPASM peptide maturase GrrM/OscB n=1 Tax=Roseibium sp. TaxID=1936156 RepID=UPI003B50A1CC
MLPSLVKTQLLVLQPTAFCNIDCKYCYLPLRSDTRQMSGATLNAIGRSIVASPSFGDSTTLVWHAGEPLVLDPEWYRRAVYNLESASSRKISRQSFQTNATLINESWLDYFEQSGVSVGVSLDGPEAINDLHRQDRRGRGTWSKAMKGIEMLNARSIPYHIIAVVTEASLSRPEDIASALVDAGPTSIGLNIEEIDGSNTESSLLSGVTQDRVREFLDRFLNALSGHTSPPRFREFDNLKNMLLTVRAGQVVRNQENSPGAIVSVDLEGNISTFSPELLGMNAPEFNDFRFGNVHHIRDLNDVFRSKWYRDCHLKVAVGVARCKKTCGHFAICGGGSPSNKFGETGCLDSTETAFCRLSVKTVLDHLIDKYAFQESTEKA